MTPQERREADRLLRAETDRMLELHLSPRITMTLSEADQLLGEEIHGKMPELRRLREARVAALNREAGRTGECRRYYVAGQRIESDTWAEKATAGGRFHD